MHKGITIAGSLTVDIIKYIDRYPDIQALAHITGQDRSTGGLCANCALTLARLDPTLPLKAIALVGDDEAGDFVVSRFAAHPSIDISGLKRAGATSFTDVMTEQGTGRRTFFYYPGANTLLGPEYFDFSRLETDILHIGYILVLDQLDAPDPDYPTAMCRLLHAAQMAGIRTSVDVVSIAGGRYGELVPPALRYTDYCCINEYEAAAITGINLRETDGSIIKENLPLACKALMDMGVSRWAVIHMPELSCGLERDGAFVERDSWQLPPEFIKSSVGAGDAFAAGILYGAYQGLDLSESLRIAGAVAAYSLGGAGASDAIVPLAELMMAMERYVTSK